MDNPDYQAVLNNLVSKQVQQQLALTVWEPVEDLLDVRPPHSFAGGSVGTLNTYIALSSFHPDLYCIFFFSDQLGEPAVLSRSSDVQAHLLGRARKYYADLGKCSTQS